MTIGISQLFSIGTKGLFGAQSAIQITGENITNVNTEGYSRRYVRFEESYQINTKPGQIGTGVEAAEVLRHYDYFVEASYNDKASLRERYDTLYNNLRGVDNLVNESQVGGLSEALSDFFGGFYELSEYPKEYGVREDLVSKTQNLTGVVQQASDQLYRMQEQTDKFIQQDVDGVNRILDQLVEINKQIAEQENPGTNNANMLRDQRDLLIRDLGEKIDITVHYNDDTDMKILTRAGHTLLDGFEKFELKYEGAKVLNNLTPGSPFTGNDLHFAGTDDFEYTVEVVTGGAVGAAGTQFRVSLDGGRSWLTDDTGAQILYDATDSTTPVKVRDLEIWFDAGNLNTGDKFTIVPKDAVYWYEDTSTAEIISPQIYPNGEQNTRRMTGGTLAGLLEFKDNYIGRYRDKLDTFAEALVWEINSIHAEGAGLSTMTQSLGTYDVLDATQTLGSAQAGLHFGDKLQSGNMQFYVYDAAGNPTSVTMDFGGGANFDPSLHSLNDVRDALVQGINNQIAGLAGTTPADTIQVSVVNDKLLVQSNDTANYSFAFGADSTGLTAALGLNTFLQGTSARNIALNEHIGTNLSHINAGHVNGAGEINAGDNTMALELSQLQSKDVQVETLFEGKVSMTLPDFYNSLVTNVGADTENAGFVYEYQNAMASDLDARQQEVSGVNLDEEMSNLIRFQHSYTAAAKLISTADQMLQVLLSLKS